MSQYKIGTATFTNGDATLVGIGTEFLANVAIGDVVRINDGSTPVPYFVGSITTDLALELSSVYAGATATSVNYTISRDFSTVFTLPLMNPNDLQTANIFTQAMNLIDALATRALQPSILPKTGTTHTAVVVGENSAIYTNEGNAGALDISLPSAVAGARFSGYVQTAQEIKFTAAAADTIRNAAAVSAAAGDIKASTVGNFVTLQCINATEWVVVEIIGTWTLT